VSKIEYFRNPFKRALANVVAPGTNVLVPALAGTDVQVYSMNMSCGGSGGGTIDIQDTGGVSLIGGPMAFTSGGPQLTLRFCGPGWIYTGNGLGLQIVTTGGTATFNGWLDYLQQIVPAFPAGV
jgi:hypothetical protein